MTPTVSVVIPAYNVAHLVGDTVVDVLALASDAGVDIEVIVVDDGSTDDTRVVVSQLPVVVLTEEHQGVAAARNTGVAAARGPVIGMLDADDRWTNEVFTTLLPLVRDADGPAIAQGRVCDLWPDDGLGPPYEGLHLGSALFTAPTFAAVGPFDEGLPRHEDFEWVVRVYDRRIPKTRVLDTVLHYIRRPDGLTGSAPDPDPLLVKLSRTILQRRQREDSPPAPDDFPHLAEYLGVVPPEAQRRPTASRR